MKQYTISDAYTFLKFCLSWLKELSLIRIGIYFLIILPIIIL